MIEKLQRMGRRRFLENLANLGVSTTSLGFMTQESVAKVTDNPKKEIPYVELLRHSNHKEITQGGVPKRDPVWNTIPHRKWIRVRAAHDAAQKINDVLNKNFDSHWISAGVTSKSGDSYQKRIVVNYDVMNRADGSIDSSSASISKVERVVPDTFDGEVELDGKPETIKNIPVVVEKRELYEPCSGGYYDDNFGDTIPTGTRIGENGSSGTLGTPATRFSDSQGVMVTAAHVLEGDSTTFDHVHQPGESSSVEDLKVDSVATSDSNDSGYCTPYDDQTFQWRLADNDGTVKNPEIMGIVTWETLQNKEGDSNYEMKQQGNRTGTTSGYVTETVSKDSGVKNVWTNCENDLGDSGGPIYHELYNDDLNRTEIYIAAVLNFNSQNPDNSCPFEKGGGNAMEYVEDLWTIAV